MTDWVKTFENAVVLQSMEAFKESLGEEEREHIDYTWGHVRHRSFDTTDLIFQVIEVNNEGLVIWARDGEEWIVTLDDFKAKMRKEALSLVTKEAAVDWFLQTMFRHMR